MIAKIGRGSKIYGALLYNHNKVLRDNGQILHMNNMLETPDGNYTTGQILASFVPNLAANKNTEKTAIHISINPDPHDILSDDDFINIANEYMTKMGYANQPYVVFKHNDIDRTHIHIVSTTVDENGIKISDVFEKKKSMEICRQIEKKYKLIPADQKISSDERFSFTPVDHNKGNIKSQIASIVRYLPAYYNFQNLGSYNALLSLFNINAEHIKKNYKGEIKEGLVYSVLDAGGTKIGNPFKASLFGKQAGLIALRSHFEKSKILRPEIKEKTSLIISAALTITSNEKEFTTYLIEHGINTVIRRNEQGRLYGITFIDHNTGHVLNGSHLGKQFSANVFQKLFADNKLSEPPSNKQTTPPNHTNINMISLKDELHPLFDFMINSGSLIGEWGLLDSLLLGGMSEDPEEQIFEFNMKKKKRRRRQSKN
ncbi:MULTISPECIES: conjugal transfer protein MobB [Chryseobacterium]|uniref:Relaxase/Mobilisation nuclease domain n=2 Tax=Chryseobacterium gleum TaxID=250 RepID=A0A3S4MG28_CHRGE|nr:MULTISPECIES: conjugal transfer protein MobB [Chryseobacterium]EFK36122.1 relaxase/mobilization nuclease domain protein [Chryseobacterium gleum ATCC 35910]QQY31820.1 relaxase/mobilization nuclease domain-containing protein [Chryseobacterium gleum]VEE11089.1 Relaxase/Mobilisation nuclease domain [Chryseobacterium gleum]VFA43952.1 Relaxase/Mobilisation nuclease domain [Chryseobacterium indologenes]